MGNEFDISNNKQIKRGNPNWKKGKSANPKGRPPGIKNFTISDLIDAIREVEKEKEIGLYKKFVNKAYVNSAVMIALIKKLIPDKTHTEIEGVGDTEIIMSTARESFKRKLDDIAKRLDEVGKNTDKQDDSNIDKDANGGKK